MNDVLQSWKNFQEKSGKIIKFRLFNEFLPKRTKQEITEKKKLQKA